VGGIFSRPFIFPPFLPFSLSFLRLKVASQIQQRDIGERYWLHGGGKRHFAAIRHVPRALNTPEMRLRPSSGHKRIFNVFRAQGTCLTAANFVLFLLKDLKLEANVVVFNVLHVTVYSFIKL